MESAVARWQALIRARASQMDAAYERLGRSSADFWDRRARGYHRATRESAPNDRFYWHLRERITPESSVLDVGAGTGRFALALAPYARHVTALEPNASMLTYLRQEIEARGLTNLTTVQRRWEDALADLQADIVVCSHVLYPILDIVPFLEKLHQASKQTCYLYLRATPIDLHTASLWQHFHGSERQFPPGYIAVLDVLYELGIYANVEVVTVPFTLSYQSPQEAEDQLMEQLILQDNEHTRRELRALLANWLVEANDHTWHSHPSEDTSAIIWWPCAG